MNSFDVIDDAPTSRFHRKLLIACCGGPFLDGYILSLVGIALVGFAKEIDTTTVETGLIGAASLIGIFFGAIGFGALTDRIGREKMYALDLLVLVASCALTAFVTVPWQLIALRFIIGLAIGADYPIATSLLAEFTPTARRGMMIGLSGLAWSVGAMMAFVVGFAMVRLSGGYELWRWMLFSGAIVGVVVVLLRRGIPESPRWLMSKGRVREAEEVLKQVYGPDVRLNPASPHSATEGSSATTFSADIVTLFRGGYLKRIVMCGSLYLAQVTPQYALYTYGAIILTAAGIQGENATTLGELLIAVLFAVGIPPALKLIESRGRRPMTLWPFFFMFVALASLGLWHDAPSWFVVSAFAFYAFWSGGPSVIEWIYPNELFPTAVRATAVGIVVGISRFGAATGTYLLPVSITALGLNATLLIGAAITAAAFAVCFALAPETKGRPLAETSSIHPVGES